MASKSTQSKYQHQQKLSNMEKNFRKQLLVENRKKEKEVENVDLKIEERAISKNGPFVLIRNKKNKWVITTCGALVNGKEFNTKEEAEEHLSKKTWDDILTTALIFISHVNNQMINPQEK